MTNNDLYIKELEGEVTKLRNENLQLLRIIGAIAYKNDGRIRVSQRLTLDMIKHSVVMYEDFREAELVISVY